MHTWRIAFAALLTITAILAAGCGSKDTDAVTANIAGSQGGPQAPAIPKVLIHTSLGDITVELDPDHAPLTVENFLSYVGRGFYDQTLIHQVESEFIVLAGGYDLQLQEKQTNAAVRNEADHGQRNVRGTIAMAREPDAIDSARSQFFFNLVDNSALDHKGRDAEQYGYCAFGKVIAGMDVVDKIARVTVKTEGQFEKLPAQSVAIESIRTVR